MNGHWSHDAGIVVLFAMVAGWVLGRLSLRLERRARERLDRARGVPERID